MKKRTFAMASVLLLGACGSPESDQAAPPANPATTSMDGGTAASTPGAPGPADFVQQASASDMFEIEAGTIARDKAQNEEVVAFAEMMIADHTLSSENLLAATAGDAALTPNPQLTPLQQQNLEALRAAAEGEAFDTLYIQQQIVAHEMTLQLLQTFARSGEHPTLAGFASETAPVVERHLAEVQQMR